MEPLIKCEHVDLGYENQDAVINVNMEVCSGDYLCIVGENGSGGDAQILINKGATPMDKNADLLIQQPIGQVLGSIRV